MGMDVLGRKPRTKHGKLFLASAWWWGSLADYCIQVAPDITGDCKYWHSNDGAGLDGEDSTALADRLQVEIDSGRCARYADGVLPITVGVPYLENNTWRVGKGSERPFSVEHVKKFVVFLRSCGGFSIW